ncbi:MAG: DUF1015 domain-containing protein [Candidatus Omnitrophica bacterium]|nr:DUF1015 domain-containing protein [Candidatus Omnitrophota bacterium]
MPFIEPFKGLRYDPRRVGSLSRVVTPPYDVISPQGQSQYYRKHPWNFVRVVFGKSTPNDTAGNNRYTRARKTLEEWISRGILKFDPEPSVYPYLQEYRFRAHPCRRWGVVALVRLDSGKIYRHEETKSEPKLDRLKLLQSVEASLSPIFGLIPDPKGQYRRGILRMCGKRPPVQVASVDGVRHSLWRVSDPRSIRGLQSALRSRELVIADGHHRFESALTYRNQRRAQDPSPRRDAPYNHVMFYLAAAGSEEPGLLPTHRVVSGLSKRRLEAVIRQMFDQGLVRRAGSPRALARGLEALRGKGRVGVGLYTGNGSGSLLLSGPRQALRLLDVEWLHEKLLPQWMEPETEISYTQDLDRAVSQVRHRRAQASFILSAPNLQEVFRRARADRRMPGKTTYFYPKPLAGLVEYKF